MSLPGWKQRTAGALVALAVISGVLLLVDSLSDDGAIDLETTGGAASLDGADATRDPGELAITGTTIDPNATEVVEAESLDESGEPDEADVATDRDQLTAPEFESIRNQQEKFTRFASVPSEQLDLGALTEPGRASNGSSSEGQFRLACEYSHFSHDDPIIFPGEPGAAHLHMFFGNTEADAFTTEDELINSGGSTCNGFELNRSAYWTPALLDGRGNVVVPDSIIIYYKTKQPQNAIALPQGLQMLAGNTDAESFENSQRLFWSCGGSGSAYNQTNRIPECGGDRINATIQFPNCWDGTNLASEDFKSHLTFVSEESDCPGSHSVRLPQISILLYFPGAESVDGWHLSSDLRESFNGPPGGTLHADWWGGWNDEAIELWTNGCIRAAQNCSFGQTGTDRQLAPLNDRQLYEGDNFLPLPAS